ncbi:MAG: class I SAM-dependent methyltransferase [Acidimicrobiia bacterium]
MPLPHDPEYAARHYDAYGDEEWQRHDRSLAGRTSVAVHRAFLAEFIRPGDVVLDAGAGPGFFTITLAELGARVHVGDISPVQLRLNAERVADAGHEGSVRSRTLLDICDLSMFADETFDAVVCFGGPLSYVLNRAPDAVAELCRVTRPGGHVLLSVMSTLGSLRRFVTGVLDVGRQFGPHHNDEIVDTGDLPRDINDGHECHMYRWSELAALLEPHGTIVGASASNFVTAQADTVFEPFTDEEIEPLLRWELELCREPGALDGGTHILAVLRVP